MQYSFSRFLLSVLIFSFSSFASAQVFDKNGTVYIVEHSHSDIAWSYTIEGERAVRNKNLKNAFDFMRKDTTFKWTIENVLYFKNWIEDNPETEDEIMSYFRKGRLDCGATYTQPMEDCMYNELLVRQMYFGKRWFEKKYPNIELELVNHPDGPLRGLQTQQVYKKSGVNYLRGSRMETPPFFKWFSPDGSYLFSYFQIGYWGRPKIDSTYIANFLSKYKFDYYNTRDLPAITSITWGHDYNDPYDFSKTIHSWNVNQVKNNLPKVKYGTFFEVLKGIDKPGIQFPEIHGNVPNWWLYENWPTHNRLMSLQREAAKMLTTAEIFHTIKATQKGDYSEYPAIKLSQAWENAIYACHTIVPRAYPSFLKKYENAHEVAQFEMNSALQWLADRVAGRTNSTTIVVFNPLSWVRTDPVTVDISALRMNNIQVFDEKNELVPSQVTTDGKLVFIASDIPSIGYKSYYLVNKTRSEIKPEPEIGKEWTKVFQSEHYKISPGKGGLKSIYDRDFNKELLNTDKWLGGEWTSFYTDARGASESIDFEPKPQKYFERMSQLPSDWKCIESGPIYVTWETGDVVATHCKPKLLVTAYRNLKRIDFTAFIAENDDTVRREQRIMFPISTNKPQIAYEVPFGVVETGKSEAFDYVRKGMFSVNPPEIPAYPREVQNWIYAAGEGIGITIGTSVGASAFKDFGPNPEPYPIISPILLANTTGLEGSLLQPGDFRFNFSITSHEEGYQNGYKIGIQSQTPLIAILKKENSISPKLPRSKSFLEISNDNCILSAMKKAEDNDNIIIRFYEVEGKIANTGIRCDFNIKEAFRTNMIEMNSGKINFSGNKIVVPTGKYSIETLMIKQ